MRLNLKMADIAKPTETPSKSKEKGVNNNASNGLDKMPNEDSISQDGLESDGDDTKVKMGEHYLVRRLDNTWRRSNFLCL